MAHFIDDPAEQSPLEEATAHDKQNEDEFLHLTAGTPTAASYEAFQYKIKYPEFDLDHIQQNLDTFRRQARAEQVNWATVAEQHPTLAKYLRDPDRMGLAMQDSALLTGAQRFIGGRVPTYVDQGKPGTPEWKYTAPGWAQRLSDASNANLGYTFDKLAAMPWEVMDWATDKAARLTGTEKGGFFADQARYWNQRAAIYEPYRTGNKDYQGNSFRESGKIARAANFALSETAEMAPLMALGGAAGAAGGPGALVAFNSLYSAPGVYDTMKKATGSAGEAAALTAIGAPIIGKAMSYTPLGSAQGQALSQTIERGMARIAAEMTPGFWKLTRMWAAKAGVDVAAGQLSLGAMHAASGFVDQTARAIGGEEVDPLEPVRNFFQGVRDPSMLGLHAFGIAQSVGRFQRARADVKRVNEFVDHLEKLFNTQGAAFQEEALRSVAAADSEGDTHLFIPMDRFHEEAAKNGWDPKAVASTLHGDDGEAYAAALATHEDHLAIPVERLGHLKTLGLTDLAKSAGKFDPTLENAEQLGERSRTFVKAMEDALKVDPETLPDDQTTIYDALKGAVADGETAHKLLAEITALRTQHPEKTLDQVFDAVYGKGGIFGPPLDAANEAVPGMHREVEATTEPLIQAVEGPFTDKKWFAAFRDEQAKESVAQAMKDAAAKARERLRDAVKNGVRKFMPEERATAEGKARVDIQKDPVYRALHWFQTGELWGDGSAAARLKHPDTQKPLRLLDREIDGLMGPGAAEALKERRQGIVTSDPRAAIDVDAAANALGFTGSAATGDPARKMLAGLRDALTEGQYVKQLADLRLKETFGGDLLTNPRDLMAAVLDAVHSPEMARVMLKTYRELASKLDPITRARSAMTPEMWQAAADSIITRKLIKDSAPERFANAAKAAAERALAAVDKDVPSAANHAEAAVLYHYLYKTARALHDNLDARWSEIGRAGTSETVRRRLGYADPDAVNTDGSPRPAVYLSAHDALLTAVGILPEREAHTPDPTIVNRLIERIKDNAHDQWLSTLGWDPEVVQRVITDGKHWNRLTPDEAFQVHLAIKNLQTLAKNATGVSQALGAKTIEEMKAGVVSYLRGGTGEGPTHLPAPFERSLDTLLERQRREGGLRGILTSPLRAGAKIADMLGWSADAGIAPWNRTSEIGPVGEAVMAKFREARNQRDAYMREFFHPWQEIRKHLDLDPKLVSEAPGANRELGLRARADNTDVSHQWLLNLARWWGDMDGRARVAHAYGLTPASVERTLARYFTPEQLDAVQAEKALVDQKLRPQLAAVHMRRTGTPLKEVEPAPFTVKWADGTTREYKGGYYPIHWDGRPGLSQSRVGEFSNSGRMPRVPSEFLIERQDSASREPDLNWAGMPNHMLRVAHNLAFGDFVQDAARVLLDRDVQKEVAAYRGDEFAQGLGRWLERVALDVSGGPDSTFNAADKNAKLRILRRTLVRSTVAFNYPILAAHTAHPIGTGEARYGAQYAADYSAPAMADVLRGYTEVLATGQNTLREFALASGPELQHRANTLREEMGRWMLDREFKQTPTNAVQKLMYAIDEHVIEGAGMWHLRMMDEAFSTATWVARYRKGIDDGLTHEEAAKLGDKEVFETMPTYSQMEQPEILADKHSLRSVGVIWHTYYGAWRSIWRDARYEGARRPAEEARALTGRTPFAADGMNEAQVFGRMAAGLGMALVLGAYFKGSGPEKHEKVAGWALKRAVMAPAEVLPYAGQMMESAVDLASGKKPRPVDFENTYLSPLAHAAGALESLGDRRKTTEDRVMKLSRAGAEFIGFPKPVLNAGQFAYHGSEWWNRQDSGPASTAADFTSHVFYPHRWGRNARFQQHNPIMDAASMLEAN